MPFVMTMIHISSVSHVLRWMGSMETVSPFHPPRLALPGLLSNCDSQPDIGERRFPLFPFPLTQKEKLQRIAIPLPWVERLLLSHSPGVRGVVSFQHTLHPLFFPFLRWYLCKFPLGVPSGFLFFLPDPSARLTFSLTSLRWISCYSTKCPPFFSF